LEGPLPIDNFLVAMNFNKVDFPVKDFIHIYIYMYKYVYIHKTYI
jgi:HD superfamily phosphohydrolase